MTTRVPTIGSRQTLTGVSPVQRKDASVEGLFGSLVDFTSLDLLSFSTHPRIKRAAQGAIESVGIGSLSALSGSGLTQVHGKAIGSLCSFLRAADAALFPTRAQTLLSLFAAHVTSHDTLLADANSSGAGGLRDLAALLECGFELLPTDSVDAAAERVRTAATRGRAIVFAEAISLSGFGSSNILKILDKSRSQSTFLVLDESASIGAVGLRGGGACESLEPAFLPWARVVDFGVCAGLGVTALVGDADMVSLVTSRSQFVANEPTVAPMMAAALDEVLRIVPEAHSERALLGLRATQLFEGLVRAGFKLGCAMPASIVSVSLPKSVAAPLFCSALQAKGFLVRPFSGLDSSASSVRVVVSTRHQVEQVAQLISAMVDTRSRLAN